MQGSAISEMHTRSDTFQQEAKMQTCVSLGMVILDKMMSSAAHTRIDVLADVNYLLIVPCVVIEAILRHCRTAVWGGSWRLNCRERHRPTLTRAGGSRHRAVGLLQCLCLRVSSPGFLPSNRRRSPVNILYANGPEQVARPMNT